MFVTFFFFTILLSIRKTHWRSLTADTLGIIVNYFNDATGTAVSTVKQTRSRNELEG